ncbi:MAG TPA: SRPBCC domain-containing protein [Vicinamibacteria bacterium]|nr:SRPBCC domain-containing protein [Vicinamibacteria bacterium]
MRFEGSLTIRAPREKVWGFLTDPEKVSRCAPGLETLEVLAPGQRFRAVASVGFGAVKATFANEVEWLDLEPPSRARMKVHGTAPGSAVDATSEMRLADAPEGHTAMAWSAEVSVVGTIASVAARLMGSVAQRLTDAFFDAVRRRIEAYREFRFGPVPLDAAEGRILGHNVAGLDGRPALRKGRPLSAEDVARLRDLGRTVVYVAELGTDDVGEDAAARRVAEAATGDGLRLSGTSSGRVNLVATALGVLRLDPARLGRVNEVDGVAFATPPAHSVVRAGQVVATVKIIPYALPEGSVRAAERLAREGGPLLRVDALAARQVGLILSGSLPARGRIVRDFEGPLRARVEALGSALRAVDFVPLEEDGGESALADALLAQARAGASLVVLAGETAIVDRHDIAPRAIERAGGVIACFGAPVDPGNLLLLAYLGSIPVLGAPGCVRSPKVNVIDWVLPRLLTGERLSHADVVALGHGGLLEDVPERRAPREALR